MCSASVRATSRPYWGRTGYHNNLSTTSTKQRFKGSFYMLPEHGLEDSALRGDKVRLNSFLCRCWKLRYSDRNMTFEDMCSAADEQLFNRLVNGPNHVLHKLLPPPTTASQRYNCRSCRHTLQLPEHRTSLLDSNFIVRMLYKGGYIAKLHGFVFSSHINNFTSK